MGRARKLDWGEGTTTTRRTKSGEQRVRLRRVVDGVRISVTGASQKDAENTLNDAIREMAEGPQREIPTLGEWAAEWLAEMAEGAPKTLENRAWALARLEPLHSIPLDELDTPTIERFLRTLTGGKQGLSKSTVTRIRTNLSLALNDAVRWKLIPGNPANLTRIPKQATPPRDGRSLTTDQAQALLTAAEGDPWAGAIVLGLRCGLRPQELRAQKWRDVDLKRGRLVVTKPKGKSDRTIALAPDVIDTLKRVRADQLARGTWRGEGGFVATTKVGTPADPANLRREVRRLARAAGISAKQGRRWTWDGGPELTPYGLRHTCASLLMEWTGPNGEQLRPEDVSDFLGHTDTRMLNKHYRHRTRSVVDVSAAMGTVYQGTGS